MKKKNLRIAIIIAGLLFVYTFLCAMNYASAVSYDISDKLFRLHVIANSDSDEDQSLKYKVRDALIEYMNEFISEDMSKDEVVEVARAHSNEFKKIALQTIKENGYNYDVNVEIGNFEFPTKTYGDISLPSGNYDALRVKIGEASGQNWWCVMFPPLCFIDFSTGVVPEESKEYMKENMSEEEYALISNGHTGDVETFDAGDEAMSFKFKILELFHF